MREKNSTQKQRKLTGPFLSVLMDVESEHHDIKKMDLTTPGNSTRYFPFGLILRNRDIDATVGRNTILAFLRFLGILDKRNKPSKKWIQNSCFKMIIVKKSEPTKLYSEYTFISGFGIYVIRGLIGKYRETGASI